MNTILLYTIYSLIIVVLTLVSIHLIARLAKPRLRSKNVTEGETKELNP